MPATISKSNDAVLRRERFREYMRALNPAAPARVAIESGLVVEDLNSSLFKTMAARADLDPGSQQLVVGGIGAGKTTELLMAEKWLENQGQTIPLYIDISSETNLAGFNSGALLAGFGLHLISVVSVREPGAAVEEEEKEALEAAQSQIREFAFGKTVQTWVPDYDDGYYEGYEDSAADHEPGHLVTYEVPGKLKPRFPVFQRDIQDIRKPLALLMRAVQKRSLDVVVIFDGLDRLISPDKFWAVVDQDFRALRRMQVAVLAAAPLSILYGAGRSISEHFDRIHHIHTLGSTPDSANQLKSVLSQRGGSELLGPVEMAHVCSSSGGVLRDLVTLARDAGEAAYIEGSEKILLRHAMAAVKQMGEGYLRGLGPEQLKILRRVAKERSFNTSSKPEIELLVTGRVLEYSGSDFRVHPALRSLILAQGEDA